jgi:crotonobetainyl-CoA:carnitine CoA-transferase CaiB-like acyl-CoA transferase
MNPTPLRGIRVLDLSRVLAGPWAGQLLADYGADVIKVERPGTGDDTRAWGPPWWGAAEDRMSAYYLCTNRGKRSVAIDIAASDGAEQVRALAREADVLIENYKVGQLARYGLGPQDLLALHPGLIYCSVTGYGQDGPDAQKAGYDFAIQAAGGLMSVTGEREGTAGSEPQKVGVAVVDLMTGVYAVTAILAALHERSTTGRGTHIDMALLDVQVAMLANQAANYLIGGQVPQRMGNAHPNIVPYQVFATRDGHIVLAVGNDGQFAKFCSCAGHPDAARDSRFTSNAGRVQHRQALVPLIAAWMLSRDTAQWAAELEAHGVPCAPIHDVSEVFSSPQVIARGMRMDLSSADGTAVPAVASPVRFNAGRLAAPSPPPRLDQHGDLIRQSLSTGTGWPTLAPSLDSRTNEVLNPTETKDQT